MKYIISGGGTGGHIFPAVAIGKAILREDPNAEILFVGAENRMEMQRVPAEGFRIEGLPVAGFNRSNPLKNIKVLAKLYKSIRRAARIIDRFQPDVAIGVGGYASGPVLKQAQKKNIPTLIQEQNSYAGVTNKLLAKKAGRICVAYDNMERFFPADRIVKTGNPLRPAIKNSRTISQAEAKRRLGFDSERKLIVAVGGSLGAMSINKAVEASLHNIINSGASLLLQTGNRYYAEHEPLQQQYEIERVKIMPFIESMDLVYAAADLLISRAGASTISEIQFLGVPSVLIPSPNVAEDHQRKNAEALSSVEAAIFLPDNKAVEELPSIIASTIKDSNKLAKLAKNAESMGIADADTVIARMAVEMARHKNTSTNGI